MYYPLFITFLYCYISVKKGKNINPNDREFAIVWANITITEVIYLLCYLMGFTQNNSPFSLLRLVFFLITKDIIHHIMGNILNNFYGSDSHYNNVGSWYAWHYSIKEHLLMNILPFILCFVLFPNSSWVLFSLIGFDIYKNITFHSNNTERTVEYGRYII
jgi:hypothetical protein